MKILSALLIFSCMMSYVSGQTSFVINNIHGPDNEYISDIQYANSRYYAVSVNTESTAPFRKFSTLSIFNNMGQLTTQVRLGENDDQYFRILSIDHNKVKLVGTYKHASCTTVITLSEYDITSATLHYLAQYNLCEDRYVHSIRIVPGIDEKTFLEVLYSPNEFNLSENSRLTIFLKMEADMITLIPDIEEHESHLSVDFSGKGYVVRWAFVCEYYDRDFNFKRQWNNGTSGYATEQNSFIQPLVNHYLLEHVLFEDEDHKRSEQIRLIDSNLHTKKSAIIDPQPNANGVRVPLYGGLALGHYNAIWATANFGKQYNPVSNYFSITRLDSDLKIVCTQFIGYDAVYMIIGITAFEDNGAIVYGYTRPKGSEEDTGDKDIFAMKVGQECELITTATFGPVESLVSISAYPNPGINDLTFSINGFDPSTLQVEFVDESGKILFTKKDLSNSIQIPQLPNGQYFYRILQKEKLLGVGSWVKE